MEKMKGTGDLIYKSAAVGRSLIAGDNDLLFANSQKSASAKGREDGERDEEEGAEKHGGNLGPREGGALTGPPFKTKSQERWNKSKRKRIRPPQKRRKTTRSRSGENGRLLKKGTRCSGQESRNFAQIFPTRRY